MFVWLKNFIRESSHRNKNPTRKLGYVTGKYSANDLAVVRLGMYGTSGPKKALEV